MVGICTDSSFVNALDRNRVEVIPAFAAAPFDDEQICFLQHTKLLYDGGAIGLGQ